MGGEDGRRHVAYLQQNWIPSLSPFLSFFPSLIFDSVARDEGINRATRWPLETWSNIIQEPASTRLAPSSSLRRKYYGRSILLDRSFIASFRRSRFRLRKKGWLTPASRRRFVDQLHRSIFAQNSAFAEKMDFCDMQMHTSYTAKLTRLTRLQCRAVMRRDENVVARWLNDDRGTTYQGKLLSFLAVSGEFGS